MKLPTYLYLKLMQGLLYNHNLPQTLEYKEWDNCFFTKSFIEIFIKYLTSICEQNRFDRRFKYNAYYLINYIIDNNDLIGLDKKQLLSKLNALIRLVNINNDCHKSLFYNYHLKTRLSKSEYYKWIFKTTEEIKTFVINCLNNDFPILASTTNFVSNTEYQTKFINTFGLSQSFFYSLKIIIHECPEIIDTSLFHKRVNQMIDYNQKHLNQSNLTLRQQVNLKREMVLFKRKID